MKSIRVKLIFWVCILFTFIGVLIILPLSKMLPQKIASQILKRDAEIAKHVSNEARNLLLFNDKTALSILLHDNLDRLEDAKYLFIRNPEGNIVSHTFAKGFPRALLSFNIGTPYLEKIKKFLNDGKIIYDISTPILNGEIGTLHLGVSLESGKKDIEDIARINYYVAFIILIGLGAGIIVFLIIGLLFSNQIIKLKNFATDIGKGNLEDKIIINSKDEIEDLASALNEMVSSLKEKIQEIKKLNTAEERNRIALDLHDGCSQELANIIKRLELSERLFKIDPEKAFQELKTLRESTRGILNKTRQVIFDLKSPEDANFSLLENLTNYVKEYNRQTDINVKLDIGDSLNNISPDKSKSIFYVISEALTNIRKHSLAKNAELSIGSKGNGSLTINIKDDGKGFDIDDTLLNASNIGKFGLISMRQRTSSLGGTFFIDSRFQQGTRISISIPLGDAKLERL